MRVAIEPQPKWDSTSAKAWAGSNTIAWDVAMRARQLPAQEAAVEKSIAVMECAGKV